jgi:hypothetical protein
MGREYVKWIFFLNLLMGIAYKNDNSNIHKGKQKVNKSCAMQCMLYIIDNVV